VCRHGLGSAAFGSTRLCIGAGDEVIVSFQHYIATWLAVFLRRCQAGSGRARVRALPIFDPARSKRLTSNPGDLPVHLYGQPDMDPIIKSAQKHGLKVIEDMPPRLKRGRCARYKKRTPHPARLDRRAGIATTRENLGALGDAGRSPTNRRSELA